MSEQCSEDVHNRLSRWPMWHRCGNKGKVEREGKWYCNVHDPEKVAAKAAAQTAKWKAKSDSDTAYFRRIAPLIVPHPLAATAAYRSSTGYQYFRVEVNLAELERLLKERE